METKIRRYIEKHALLKAGDRTLVAYSGGPDSTCLLLLLRKILKDTAAVYVNHRLRGKESQREQSFVVRFCRKQGIPLFVETIHWKKIPGNLEEAARNRRYRHLVKAAEENGFHKIALAHQRDDAIETFLMRMIRGSGPQGLSGIQPKRERFIRPLLECSKTEILQYLQERNIPYFSDTTNSHLHFQRNRIRKELIPYVEKHFNPQFRNNLERTISWIQEQNELLAELVKPYETLITQKEGKLSLKRSELAKLSVPLRKAVLKKAMQKADPSLRIPSRTWARLLGAIEDGKNLELPGFLQVQCMKNVVEISGKSERTGVCEIDIPSEGVYAFPPANARLRFHLQTNIHYQSDSTVACLDATKASFPLHVRNWKKGDVFRPLGMRGHKKLSDFLIDRKVPRAERKKIPLVFKNDDLLWVAGFQINHDFRITARTKKVLRIRLGSAQK